MKNTISFVLLIALTMTNLCPAAEHAWGQKADMPAARGYHSTSVVNGKVYAFGGATSEPNPVAVLSVDIYDPITDSWTQAADIPTPRVLLSTSVVSGKIYAIGGGTGYPSLVGLSMVEEYDPTAGTWMRKADMPTARWGLSTSTVDGKVYAIGGRPTSGIPVSTVEEYDPATDTWTRKADMPTARWGLSTSVVDGKIYAIGGGSPSGGGSAARPIVEVYDPSTDTWTKKADMPTVRRNLSTAVVAGRIYGIGGWYDSNNHPYPTVEQYG